MHRSTEDVRYTGRYTYPILGLERIRGQASTKALRESGTNGTAGVLLAEVIPIDAGII